MLYTRSYILNIGLTPASIFLSAPPSPKLKSA